MIMGHSRFGKKVSYPWDRAIEVGKIEKYLTESGIKCGIGLTYRKTLFWSVSHPEKAIYLICKKFGLTAIQSGKYPDQIQVTLS
jgi:hypothetical protein